MQLKKATFEQFFHTYRIGEFTVSKDESKLIYTTDITGDPNLWAIDLKENNAPYLFSKHDQSVSTIEISSENSFVLAGFDKDGDENTQIYILPLEGGYPEPFITGEPSEKYFFTKLTDDDKRVYYNTSKDNPNFLDTRVYTIETQEDTLLHSGEKSPTYLCDISEDEESLAFVKVYSNTHQHAYVKKGEEWISLLPETAEPPYTVSSITFVSNDSVYFVTDYQSELSYLVRFNLNTKTSETILSFKDENISYFKWHKRSETFVLLTSSGVEDKLYRFDPKTRDLDELVSPSHIINKVVLSKSGTIYLSGSSATMPTNIFRSVDGIHWEMLTANRVLGIDPSDMVEPDTITYRSFDGMEIEALLFEAKEENNNGFTIFWPHGGPQAAEQKNFRSLFQALVYNGYTIFAPNFRGSTGYGKTFTTLVEGDWGGAPRLDNVAGIEWLFEQGIASKETLFLMGGSFGGYMSLLLHGRHAGYFRAVVDLFGPSNLFSFYQSVPAHWQPLMKLWLGDPEVNKEKFIEDSPITYLDTMIKPMLVIQGAKDPRVVKEESDQIVEKLKDKDCEVDYMVLEDEGHGFARKENEIAVYKKVMEFLKKHH